MDCIFCKIINQEIPAIIHHENDDLIVIDDISPKAPIHRLIIPKRHIATPNHLTISDQMLIGHMYTTAIAMAKTLQISEQGYRLVMNCNHDGGQTVFHLHLHFLGGRTFTWPPG